MSKEFMNEATLKRLIEKIKSEFSKYLKRDGLSVTAEQGDNVSVTQSDTAKGVELKFTIPKGEKGDPGESGPPGAVGEKGDPGYTPQKGIDYFTPEDIESLNIPTVDAELSDTSENAVQNKAVALKFNDAFSEITVAMGAAQSAQSQANLNVERINSLYEQIGDIDAALEELHTYAQALIGGAE